MMRSAVGRFLTGSPVMRTGYAVLKAVTFGLLLLLSGLEKIIHLWQPIPPEWIPVGFKVGAWIAAATAVVCLVRGIPVIIEGIKLIQEQEAAAVANHSAGH